MVESPDTLSHLSIFKKMQIEIYAYLLVKIFYKADLFAFEYRDLAFCIEGPLLIPVKMMGVSF